MTALFIILVYLTMTLFSEKCLFPLFRCIHGFMSSSVKKSWTDSTRDFFCCNPSKKDSLDKIKTSQSIWKEFLKTISQPTHQSKMQVAIFISKNPIELCFLEPFFSILAKLEMAKNSNCKWEEIFQYAKGQIKPYADWRAVDFPKEQTFCFWANIHRANLHMV